MRRRFWRGVWWILGGSVGVCLGCRNAGPQAEQKVVCEDYLHEATTLRVKAQCKAISQQWPLPPS